MVDIDDVVELLAKFHDWDEALLEAWKDSGIEAGLEVLYEAIDVVRWDSLAGLCTCSLAFWLVWSGGWVDFSSQEKYSIHTDLPYQHNPVRQPLEDDH